MGESRCPQLDRISKRCIWACVSRWGRGRACSGSCTDVAPHSAGSAPGQQPSFSLPCHPLAQSSQISKLHSTLRTRTIFLVFIPESLSILPAPHRPLASQALGQKHSRVYFVLSWQAWLCGGSVEILPCSRVGHIYGPQDAHSPLEQEAALQSKVRIAETWLGAFKETFYRHNPEALSLSKVRGEPGRGFCA